MSINTEKLQKHNKSLSYVLLQNSEDKWKYSVVTVKYTQRSQQGK